MGVDYRAGIAFGYNIDDSNLEHAANVLGVSIYNVCEDIEDLTNCELFCLDSYVYRPYNYIFGIVLDTTYDCESFSIDSLKVDDSKILEMKEVYEKYFKLSEDEEDEPQYLYYRQVS